MIFAKKAVLLFLFPALLMCSGCSLFHKDYPVEINSVKIKEQPKTVAALSESLASAVYALGYGDYLVGAPTSYCNESNNLKPLGTTVIPDKDAIINLSPEVLLVSSQPDDELASALKLRNITVVKINTPQSYDDITEYYNNIAKLFLGKYKYKETAETYLSETERLTNAMNNVNKNITKKALTFIENNYVATGDTLAGQAMKKIGISNIADSAVDYSMSSESIVSENPDIIFCPKNMSKSILENKSFGNISAVKNGAVYEIDVFALTYAGEGFCATLQDMTNYFSK